MAAIVIAVGLLIDVLAAFYIVAADLPEIGDRLVKMGRDTHHIEMGRQHLLDSDHKRRQLTSTDHGFSGIATILERRLDRSIEDSDGIEARGHAAAVGILEGGETFQDPVQAYEFREWIDNDLEKRLRRKGLGILALGFTIQIIGLFV